MILWVLWWCSWPLWLLQFFLLFFNRISQGLPSLNCWNKFLNQLVKFRREKLSISFICTKKRSYRKLCIVRSPNPVFFQLNKHQVKYILFYLYKKIGNFMPPTTSQDCYLYSWINTAGLLFWLALLLFYLCPLLSDQDTYSIIGLMWLCFTSQHLDTFILCFPIKHLIYQTERDIVIIGFQA